MKHQIIKLLRTWWPSAIVLLVILYATLWPDPLPDDTAGFLFPHADKLIHAIMMGGLVGAITFDYYRSGHGLTGRFMLTLGLGVSIFCLCDEVLQSALGLGRTAEWLDIVADMLGTWVAVLTAPPAVRAVVRRR